MKSRYRIVTRLTRGSTDKIYVPQKSYLFGLFWRDLDNIAYSSYWLYCQESAIDRIKRDKEQSLNDLKYKNFKSEVIPYEEN